MNDVLDAADDTIGDTAPAAGLRLNHAEFSHRPGEGDLVAILFAALGARCQAIDTPPYGRYFVVSLDASPHGDNDIFVTEAEPEQLALEALLLQAGEGRELARFRTLQRERPYRAAHLGIRMPSTRALDAAIERLGKLAAGPLAGRLELGHTIERAAADAQATSSPMKQIWIWTDAMSAGLLLAGQQIELQAYAP